jgi:DNA-binding GntR family transcriptional regulator
MTVIVIGVVESIIAHLREMIITGELVAGQKLNEAKLSEEFSVSRPPLREAFRTLENDRLVVSVPRKGCYVSDVSIEDLRKLFEARIMIECYAIDILEQNNIKATFESACVFVFDNEEALSAWEGIDKKERLRHLKFLADFHTKLVESAGNDLLIRFHRTLTYNLARYQYKYPYTLESFRCSQEFHRQILKQIQSGAFDTAKAILQDHLRTFSERLEKMMTKEESEGVNTE